MYEEALRVEDVVGIVIGTRPDCVSDELLDYLEELNQRTFVLVEYGIESANDETLKRINRGHDFACCRDAVERTHARGILTGAHIIIGLPGEDAEEKPQAGSHHLISSFRYPEDSSDADHQGNPVGAGVCRASLPCLYGGGIHRCHRKVHPAA